MHNEDMVFQMMLIKQRSVFKYFLMLTSWYLLCVIIIHMWSDDGNVPPPSFLAFCRWSWVTKRWMWWMASGYMWPPSYQTQFTPLRSVHAPPSLTSPSPWEDWRTSCWAESSSWKNRSRTRYYSHSTHILPGFLIHLCCAISLLAIKLLCILTENAPSASCKLLQSLEFLGNNMLPTPPPTLHLIFSFYQTQTEWQYNWEVFSHLSNIEHGNHYRIETVWGKNHTTKKWSNTK